MHMALKAHRWTRADLERLPEDGNRYELVDGELLVMAAPSVRHERIIKALARRLRPFVEGNDLGDVYDSRPCFALDENQVEPDLIVTATPFPLPDKWDDMPRPKLVIEVLSESTTRHDRVVKRGLYARAGIDAYWIVDGAARSIEVIEGTATHTFQHLLRWAPEGRDAVLEIDIPALFTEAFGEKAG